MGAEKDAGARILSTAGRPQPTPGDHLRGRLYSFGEAGEEKQRRSKVETQGLTAKPMRVYEHPYAHAASRASATGPRICHSRREALDTHTPPRQS